MQKYNDERIKGNMPFKVKLRLITDLSMVAALLLLMPYSLLGENAHEWIGIIMFLLFILHHKMNRAWIINLRHGRYTIARLIGTIIDTLILLTMLGSMTSGILISRYIFDFLPVNSEIDELGRAVHLFCGFWGFVLMSYHAGLHLGMVKGMLGAGNAKDKNSFLPNLGGFAAALYGACAFYRHRIISYLLLQTHFLMLDFNETLAHYLFDHVMIMILFMWFGYYSDRFLKIKR
ncbi:DUF4405 domain-containing protein [Clostridium sp. M62/1]|uniref:DUF4405 domain-containing protein n=1 Tax=Clostridium sp. M62/1 TaxID=411486 RepID=UPI00019733C7|nr:DUF4405 domain-containing protein [Clostridium sp. M62/1]EFE12860.1 hypothetical protein CLOM621_07046 [Clostridium sp. M62/1]UEB79223.1 DUF4405 domain-containing protein [Clostridium sp. M62/1]